MVHLGLVLGIGGDAVIRFCLASSGVWWFGFALMTFKYVPEPPMDNDEQVPNIREAYSQVWTTLKEYNKFRTLFIYMLAYFFFIDAINTSMGNWADIRRGVVLGVSTLFNRINDHNSFDSVRCLHVLCCALLRRFLRSWP